MKITNVLSMKAMVAKGFTVGLLAVAVAMAAPSKAEAQVAVGVRIGPARVYVGPGYAQSYAPIYRAPAPYYGYYRPGFYGRPYWDRHEFYRHDYDRHFERR